VNYFIIDLSFTTTHLKKCLDCKFHAKSSACDVLIRKNIHSLWILLFRQFMQSQVHIKNIERKKKNLEMSYLLLEKKSQLRSWTLFKVAFLYGSTPGLFCLGSRNKL